MTWQNWAGTASADPARRSWPRSTEEIGQAITAAGKDGLTVRALGSGHSFTPAAATSGVALDLSGWTGVVTADLDSGLVTVRSILSNIKVLVLPDQIALSKANEAFNELGSLKDEKQQAKAEGSTAPVTSTHRGAHTARRPMCSMCSHALARTLAGSSSTPRFPNAASSFTVYRGSRR